MTEWLVRLQGQVADLQEFLDEFCTQQLNVRFEEGRYYLRSSEFNTLVDHREVEARASELIPLMTGIVKLRSGYVEAVTQDAVVRVDDHRTRHWFKTVSDIVRLRSKIQLAWGNTRVAQANEAGLWMALALQDKKVMDALHFFEEETSWWSLRDGRCLVTSAKERIDVRSGGGKRVEGYVEHYQPHIGVLSWIISGTADSLPPRAAASAKPDSSRPCEWVGAAVGWAGGCGTILYPCCLCIHPLAELGKLSPLPKSKQ